MPVVNIKDISINNRNASYISPGVSQSTRGLVFISEGRKVKLPSFPFPAAITIEEWLIFNRQSSIAKLLNGPIFLRLLEDNKWQFGFGSSTYQGYLTAPIGNPMYVAVSHTFGAGQDTLIVVDGQIVNGSWFSSIYSASLSDSTDIMTVSTFDIPNLSRIQFSTSGQLPAPLSTSTNYWTIRQSGTTSKLATSRANAIAGLFINLTTTGSGSHNVSVFQGEETSIATAPLEISLGKNDVLQQFRLSSVAKSITDIRSYFNGLTG